jgi:Mn2+/Fe2+ NRAMP family transporter
MENFNLTKSEIATLRIEHKLAKKSSAKLAYRINAIILLGSGWSIANVSDA